MEILKKELRKSFIFLGFAFCAIEASQWGSSRMDVDSSIEAAEVSARSLGLTKEEATLLVHGYCKRFKEEQCVKVLRLVYNYYIHFYSQITLALQYKKLEGGGINGIAHQWGNRSSFLTVNGWAVKNIEFWEEKDPSYKFVVPAEGLLHDGLAYLPNYFIGQDIDCNIFSYDLQKEKVSSFYRGNQGRISCSLAGPTALHFITGGSDKCAHLWKINQHFPVSTFWGHQNAITAMTFVEGERQSKFLSGDKAGVLMGWDIVKAKSFYTSSRTFQALELLASSLWNPLLALSGNMCNRFMHLFDLRKETPIMEKDMSSNHTNLRGITFLDNRQFVTCGMEGLLLLWDVRNFESQNPLASYRFEGQPFYFSPISPQKMIASDCVGGMCQLAIT